LYDGVGRNSPQEITLCLIYFSWVNSMKIPEHFLTCIHSFLQSPAHKMFVNTSCERTEPAQSIEPLWHMLAPLLTSHFHLCRFSSLFLASLALISPQYLPQHCLHRFRVHYGFMQVSTYVRHQEVGIFLLLHICLIFFSSTAIADSKLKHGDCRSGADSEYTTGCTVVLRLGPSHHWLIPASPSRVFPGWSACLRFCQLGHKVRLPFQWFWFIHFCIAIF
jgi:hypothetical protein